MTSKPLPEMSNLARVRRYRLAHRRIDYVPSPDALAIITRHIAAGLDNCKAGVIDRLIVAGNAAMSGNATSQGRAKS